MKKLIGMFLLLAIFLIGGNAQAGSTDSTQHKGRHHRGHNSHSKRGGHHKGIRLFHLHLHHDKDHSGSGSHSHHGRRGNEEKETNDK